MLFLQQRYLRKHGISPTRPFLWYILGTITGLAIVSVIFFALYSLFGDFWSWAFEIAVIGLLTGFFAGFLSARYFYRELNKVK